MNKILAAIVALGAACAALTAQAQTPPRYDDVGLHTLLHGGQSRTYGLYVPPSYRTDQPAALIIALHGRFSSAKAFHALSGLRTVADARGAILVYPETAGAFWNDGGYAALARREPPADDAGFIAAVVDEISANYSVDPARRFLVGYDAGGGMAYHLACRGTVSAAGVAVVSALMWDYAAEACRQSVAPVSMLIMHGRRDEIFPVRGGEARAPVTASRLSATETVSVWRGIDGCGNEASVRGRAGSLLYSTCSSAAVVAFVGVEGGEHDWFHSGPDYQLNRQDVDAADLIDRFFFDRPSFALPAPRGSAVRSRSYLVYVPPSYRADQPMPAVVMLHGRPSSATGMALISEMNDVAERRGFIVVYPEGINNEWNAFYDLVRQRSATPQDDVRFLRTLMADLRVDLNIDPRRMYIAGFSNGGFMALRMACWASETFAGFASVGAGLYDVLTDRCRSEPAPVLIMHGTGDPSVPYQGVMMPDPQGGDPTRLSLGAQDTAAFFIRRNRCSFSGPSTTFAERGQSAGTHVVRFAPRDCANGDDVMFYIINGGGHNWPGVRGVLDEETFGPVNMDINAGEVIWDFFSQHSLSELPPAR